MGGTRRPSSPSRGSTAATRRALAEAIARRLGLGIAVEWDDALLYQARITARAPAPPPLPQQTAGYRQHPRTAGLPRDARPSFEPPPNPPALDLAAAAAELRLDLVRADTGELVAPPARRPIPWDEWLPLFLKIELALAVLGALFAWRQGSSLLEGAGVAAIVMPVAIVLFNLFAAASVVLFLAAVFVALDLLWMLLSGGHNTRPNWYDTLPLPRWRLGDDKLSGPIRPLVWRRGDVQAVVIVDHRRRRGRTHPSNHCFRSNSLCLRTRRGWIRLAKTPERPDDENDLGPIPPPVIALALEITRTLDVPLRDA